MDSNNTRFSLFEINKLIKEVISKSLPESYWVIAEISEINEHSSGHCYLELIQKDETADSIKARARANIWNYTYRMLKPYFETMTNRQLGRGMKVLVNAQIVFHELYGYSLNIIDIEPSYTLGDIELKRRETINKLLADGVMEMNKEQHLALLPKRVAIISSANAAGFQDFINQLTNNQFGYIFKYELFPSTMQGDDAEKSILNSLSSIYERLANFDLVVIARGGGAQIDLSCFDSYQLASNIAQFPLPILTGIGHDKDISVADMVSHTSLKTPTAVAEFLISKFNDAENALAELLNQLNDTTNLIMDEESDVLNNLQVKFQYYSSSSISKNTQAIENLYNAIPYLSKQIIEKNREYIVTKQGKVLFALNSLLNKQNTIINNNKIKLGSLIPQKFHAEKTKHQYWIQSIHNLNPETILQKGFSITYCEGKVLKNANDIQIGDKIVTKLNKGTIIGNIVNKEP